MKVPTNYKELREWIGLQPNSSGFYDGLYTEDEILAAFNRHSAKKSKWVPHDGVGCPVALHVTVSVKLRDGTKSPYPLKALLFNWNHDKDHDFPFDIIAYKVSQ